MTSRRFKIGGTMKILLIDFDSTIPNYALHKIELYHKTRGDLVIWNLKDLIGKVDKTYISVIFSINRPLVEKYAALPNVVIGGSGWSFENKLPDEIEKLRPKLNIGFTTRGCIRKCPFCIVWRKEGAISVYGDLYDFWDGKSKNMLFLDNNILGLPDHFNKIIDQCKKEKLIIDFNQGMDIRLMTEAIAKKMTEVRWGEIRFAYDNSNIREIFFKNLKIFLKHNPSTSVVVYTLSGFTEHCLADDVRRSHELRNYGLKPYTMIYNQKEKLKPNEYPIYSDLHRWNSGFCYNKYSFEEYLRGQKKIKDLYLAGYELKDISFKKGDHYGKNDKASRLAAIQD